MKENRFDIPELVKFCNDKNIFIYFNSVSTENFTISELSVQEIDELIDYYKRNNPKGYNYISIHNHIAFSNLIKSIEYIKEQCEQSKIQYEYMNEMIPCTRKEYKEIVLSIISSTPDIKYDETIWDYIPEKFSIRRNDYLYMKNNKPIWDLKEFFSQSTENQIKYIKEFFQEY
jgi:hypothetical protein